MKQEQWAASEIDELAMLRVRSWARYLRLIASDLASGPLLVRPAQQGILSQAVLDSLAPDQRVWIKYGTVMCFGELEAGAVMMMAQPRWAGELKSDDARTVAPLDARAGRGIVLELVHSVIDMLRITIPSLDDLKDIATSRTVLFVKRVQISPGDFFSEHHLSTTSIGDGFTEFTQEARQAIDDFSDDVVRVAAEEFKRTSPLTASEQAKKTERRQFSEALRTMSQTSSSTSKRVSTSMLQPSDFGPLDLSRVTQASQPR